MKKEKILRNYYKKIVYNEEFLALLKSKRENAINLLNLFYKEGLNPVVHGSVARGDVHEASDVDIIFFKEIPPFKIEYILYKNGFKNYFREIIMATPLDSIKLYIHLSELEAITLPLSRINKNYNYFYNFGGIIDLKQLKSDERVPGIDKRLVLIKPYFEGHEEYSVIGNEQIAAKEVGISLNFLNQRKKVLLRREKFGRTGVFLKRKIQLEETTESVLRKLANQKPIIRKKILGI
jgi:predicted nucleotidyltransferase